jgi:hypothetical protein
MLPDAEGENKRDIAITVIKRWSSGSEKLKVYVLKHERFVINYYKRFWEATMLNLGFRTLLQLIFIKIILK